MKLTTLTKATLISLSLLVPACLSVYESSDSTSKSIGSAIEIGNGNVGPDDFEVIMYYANETAPIGDDLKNFNRLVQVIKNVENSDLESLGKRIEQDKPHFADLVDFEIANLEASICGSNRKNAALVVFFNRLAREGKFKSCTPGQKLTFETTQDFESVKKKAKSDYRIESHPLVSKEGLKWALKQVKAKFEGKNALVSVILRSHGADTGSILTSPRLALRIDRLDGSPEDQDKAVREHALKSLSSHSSERSPPDECAGISDDSIFAKTNSMAKDSSFSKTSSMAKDSSFSKTSSMAKDSSFAKTNSMAKNDTFVKSSAFWKNAFAKDGFWKDGFWKDGFWKDGFSKDGFWKDGFSTIAELEGDNPGTKKTDFLKLLSKSGMRFGSVVTLSCFSSWTELAKEFSSLKVEWLIGADAKDKGIPYLPINYQDYLDNDSLKEFPTYAEKIKNMMSAVTHNQRVISCSIKNAQR
jgi:hypothetical protein